jgi:hypothetical protein
LSLQSKLMSIDIFRLPWGPSPPPSPECAVLVSPPLPAAGAQQRGGSRCGVWRWWWRQPLMAQQPALLSQGLAIAPPTTAAAPATGFDIWGYITGWLQGYGIWGKVSLGLLVILGFVLTQAKNIDVIRVWWREFRHWLRNLHCPMLRGWFRPKSEEANQPSPVPIGPGANGGVAVQGNAQGITNSGAISAERNLIMISGGLAGRSPSRRPAPAAVRCWHHTVRIGCGGAGDLGSSSKP